MRALKWIGGFLLLAILFSVAYVALFGWNWLREPVSRLATEKTGRELVIGGDLQLSLGWPLLHVRASDVKFGNPSWASQKHMLTADDVDFSL
ncbi:MAG TPA: AsmA family protein, partial [Azonexus sp.]|nr:AsmA family protein [Azonexus sp.]